MKVVGFFSVGHWHEDLARFLGKVLERLRHTDTMLQMICSIISSVPFSSASLPSIVRMYTSKELLMPIFSSHYLISHVSRSYGQVSFRPQICPLNSTTNIE
jgi:hypothetical protein